MPNMSAPVSFTNPMIRMPWSGAVNQNIPVNFAFDWSHNPFSMFTINLGRSSAPEVESEILDEVGSYGRQLGRIGEALEVLVKRLPRAELSPKETEAIEAFSVQMREIAKIKSRIQTKAV
jgi:hypothetical protein